MKYLIEYYWNKYVKHYIISDKFRITKVYLLKNGEFIKDISANFAKKGGVNIIWSNIISYRVMKRVDKMNNEDGDRNNYFLYIEYSYLGETGALLLHENENLSMPLYSGYTQETIKRNDKDRARIIGTVIQYAENASTDGNTVTMEEDVDKELHEFCGIRKNFHCDVANYRFHVRDFADYLLYKKKFHHKREHMQDIRLQVSDYMLNDYVFGIRDTIRF